MMEKKIRTKIAEIYDKAHKEGVEFIEATMGDKIHKEGVVILWGKRKFKIEGHEIHIFPPIFGGSYYIEYKCRSILKTGKPGKRVIGIMHKHIKITK